MQWTIKLEFTPDRGETVSHEIGSITRPIADLRPEEIGLSLVEGHELVRDIERRMISDQIHIYALCFRRCSHCRHRQPFKDVRTKCVLTMFGAYRFRGRRIRLCRCQIDRGCTASFFPLGHLIPRRTTPAVRHLFAELGALMPYREASRVMQMFGFGSGRAGRMTVWRHTVAVGRQIEGDQIAAVRDGAGHPSVQRLLIGIDDTYIRHHQRDASRQIQVTAGRFERDGKLAERFAFISSAPKWSPDQFQGIFLEQGADNCDLVQVMTDGDDGLRNLCSALLKYLSNRSWIGFISECGLSAYAKLLVYRLPTKSIDESRGHSSRCNAVSSEFAMLSGTDESGPRLIT
jgi:hypothetical protein